MESQREYYTVRVTTKCEMIIRVVADNEEHAKSEAIDRARRGNEKHWFREFMSPILIQSCEKDK